MKIIPFIKKRDIFIFLGFIIIGTVGMLLPKFFNGNAYAEISFDGEVVRQVDLAEDTIFWIDEMEFEVKNGSIRVVESPCHDKICVHTGFISSPAQSIVCLPQKLVVKIISSENNVDLTVG